MAHTHDSATQRQTVLLVDDEEFLRRLLARILVDAGYAVVQAENGRAALKAAQDLDGALTLAVTDIHMPVMDGLQFAREFRLLNPTVPVLFITGRDATVAADPAGPDGAFLRKPFRADSFLEAVSRLLQLPASIILK